MLSGMTSEKFSIEFSKTLHPVPAADKLGRIILEQWINSPKESYGPSEITIWKLLPMIHTITKNRNKAHNMHNYNSEFFIRFFKPDVAKQ